MNLAKLTINQNKCVGCGKCIKVCPGNILHLNSSGRADMRPITEFGWNGCWKCEHCLAVCPASAISIFGHEPKDSLPPKCKEENQAVLDSLIANRHSCRRYLDRNVEHQIIQDMLKHLISEVYKKYRNHTEYIAHSQKGEIHDDCTNMPGDAKKNKRCSICYGR